MRLLIDGCPSRPFTIDTIAPEKDRSAGRLPIVRKITRRNYGQPVAVVEEEVSSANCDRQFAGRRKKEELNSIG